MTDSAGLTAQLENIIDEHGEGRGWPMTCNGCDWRGFKHSTHVAAVITEQLEWKQEWGSSFVHSVGDKPLTTSDDPDDHDPADGSRFAKDFYRVSRWVSPWKPTP